MAPKVAKGAKAPSKSTLDRFFNPARGVAPSAPAAPPAPPLPPEVFDPDRTKYTPEDLIADTAASLRQQRALFAVYMKQEEYGRANNAAKLVGYYTGVLQKLQKADEEEGEYVRVTLESVEAAAERALEGLRATAAAVIAEMATWPLCPSCGGRHGDFAEGDKSEIRVMFEGVARAR